MQKLDTQPPNNFGGRKRYSFDSKDLLSFDEVGNLTLKPPKSIRKPIQDIDNLQEESKKSSLDLEQVKMKFTPSSRHDADTMGVHIEGTSKISDMKSIRPFELSQINKKESRSISSMVVEAEILGIVKKSGEM